MTIKEIKKIYNDIAVIQDIIKDLNDKIIKKYEIVTRLEEKYYEMSLCKPLPSNLYIFSEEKQRYISCCDSLRLCYACKKPLDETDGNLYCDYCLNGDTDRDD